MNRYGRTSAINTHSADEILKIIPTKNQSLDYLIDNLERASGGLSPEMRAQIMRAQNNGMNTRDLIYQIEVNASQNGAQAYFEYDQEKNTLSVAIVADKYASEAIQGSKIDLKNKHVISRVFGLEDINYQIDKYGMKGVAQRAVHMNDNYDHEIYTEIEEGLNEIANIFDASEKKREKSIYNALQNGDVNAQSKLNAKINKIQSHTSVTNPRQHNTEDSKNAKQGMGSKGSLASKASEMTYMPIINKLMGSRAKGGKGYSLALTKAGVTYDQVKKSSAAKQSLQHAMNDIEQELEVIFQAAYSGLSEAEVLDRIKHDKRLADVWNDKEMRNILEKSIKQATASVNGIRALPDTQETSFQNQRFSIRKNSNLGVISGLTHAGGYRGNVQNQNILPSTKNGASQKSAYLKNKKIAHKAVLNKNQRDNGYQSDDPESMLFYTGYVSSSAIEEANKLRRKEIEYELEKDSVYQNANQQKRTKMLNKRLQDENRQGAWEGGVFYRESFERALDSVMADSKKFDQTKIDLQLDKVAAARGIDLKNIDTEKKDNLIKEILCNKVGIPFVADDPNLIVHEDDNGNYVLEFNKTEAMHSGRKLLIGATAQRVTGYSVRDEEFNRQLLLSRHSDKINAQSFEGVDQNGRKYIKTAKEVAAENNINFDDIEKVQLTTQYSPKLKQRFAGGRLEEILLSTIYANDIQQDGKTLSQKDILAILNNTIGFEAFQIDKNGDVILQSEIDNDPFANMDDKQIDKFLDEYEKNGNASEEFKKLERFKKISEVRATYKNKLTQNLFKTIQSLTDSSKSLKGSLKRAKNKDGEEGWLFDESKITGLSAINMANDLEYEPQVNFDYRYRGSKINTGRLLSLSGHKDSNGKKIDIQALTDYENDTYRPSKEHQDELNKRIQRYSTASNLSFVESNKKSFEDKYVNRDSDQATAVIIGGPNSNLSVNGLITHFTAEDFDKGHIKESSYKKSIYYAIDQERLKIANRLGIPIEQVPVLIDPGMAVYIQNPYQEKGKENKILSSRYIAIDNYDAITASDAEGDYNENFQATKEIGNLVDLVTTNTQSMDASELSEHQAKINDQAINTFAAMRYDVVNKDAYFVKKANKTRVAGSTRGKTAAVGLGKINDANTSYAERMIYTSATRLSEADFKRVLHQNKNKNKKSDTYIKDVQHYNSMLQNYLIQLWNGKDNINQVLKEHKNDWILSYHGDDQKQLEKQQTLLESYLIKSITMGSSLYTRRLEINGSDKRLKGFFADVVRDPEFSGTGVMDTDIFIDNSLKRNQIGVGAGLAKTANADYDSDRLAVAIFSNKDKLGKKYGDVQSLFEAKNAAVDLRSQINYAIGKKIGAKFGVDESGTMLTDKEIADLTNDAIQTQVDMVSRYNKIETGLLANNGQAITESIHQMNANMSNKLPSNNLSKSNAIYDMMTRGLMETFTQEALSSKKVVDRMKNLNNGEITDNVIYDVANLVDQLQNADTWKDSSTVMNLLKKAIDLGIIKDDEAIVERAGLNTLGYASVLFKDDIAGFADAFGVDEETAKKMMFKFDENGNITDTGEITGLTTDQVVHGVLNSQNRLRKHFGNSNFAISDFMKRKASIVPGLEDPTNNPEYRLIKANGDALVDVAQVASGATNELHEDVVTLCDSFEQLDNKLKSVTGAIGAEAGAEKNKITIANAEAKSINQLAQEYDGLGKTVQDTYNKMMGGDLNKFNLKGFSPTSIVGMFHPETYTNYDTRLDEDIKNNYQNVLNGGKSIKEQFEEKGMSKEFAAQMIGWRATRLGTLSHELLQSSLGVLRDDQGNIINPDDKEAEALQTLISLYGQEEGKKELDILKTKRDAQTKALKSIYGDNLKDVILSGEVGLVDVMDNDSYIHGFADIIAKGKSKKTYRDSQGNIQETSDEYNTLDVLDIKNWNKISPEKRAGLFAQMALYKDSLLKAQKALNSDKFKNIKTFEQFKTSTLGKNIDELGAKIVNGKRVGGLSNWTEDMFKLLKDPTTIIRMIGLDADDSGKTVHLDMEKYLSDNNSPMSKTILTLIKKAISGETITEEDRSLLNKAVSEGTVLSGGLSGSFSYKQTEGGSDAEENEAIIEKNKKTKDYTDQLEKIRKKKLEIWKLEHSGIENAQELANYKRAELVALEKEAKIKRDSIDATDANYLDKIDAAALEKEKYDYNVLKEKELKDAERQLGSLYKTRNRLAVGLYKNDLQMNSSLDPNEKTMLAENGEYYQDELKRTQEQIDNISQTLSPDVVERIQKGYDVLLGGKISGAKSQDYLKNNFWGQLSSQLTGIVSRFLKFGAVSRIMQTVRRDIQKVVQAAKELDKAATNLRIVSGDNAETTRQNIKQYAQLGAQIGSTTTEIVSAANEWMRQGYEANEVTNLITSSMYLSKLGMIDVNTATKDLTSSLKGFKLEASQAMSIVDKLTAIDVKAATSAGEIAEGLAQFANLATLNGVDIDQASAMVATIADITQNSGSAVGASLKTIMSRYGNVKAGAFSNMSEEGGDDGTALNDVEKVLKKIGVSIRDANQQFRDFDDVLEDIANKWDTLDNVSKNAIASAFAGTRQREAFVTLLNNMDKYHELLETSQKSEGTAQKKYESYQESIEAWTKKLQAAWEDLANDANVQRFIRDITAVATGLVKSLPLILRYLTRFVAISQSYKIPASMRALGNFLNPKFQGLKNTFTGQNGRFDLRGGLKSIFSGKYALQMGQEYNAKMANNLSPVKTVNNTLEHTNLLLERILHTKSGENSVGQPGQTEQSLSIDAQRTQSSMTLIQDSQAKLTARLKKQGLSDTEIQQNKQYQNLSSNYNFLDKKFKIQTGKRSVATINNQDYYTDDQGNVYTSTTDKNGQSHITPIQSSGKKNKSLIEEVYNAQLKKNEEINTIQNSLDSNKSQLAGVDNQLSNFQVKSATGKTLVQKDGSWVFADSGRKVSQKQSSLSNINEYNDLQNKQSSLQQDIAKQEVSIQNFNKSQATNASQASAGQSAAASAKSAGIQIAVQGLAGATTGALTASTTAKTGGEEYSMSGDAEAISRASTGLVQGLGSMISPALGQLLGLGMDALNTYVIGPMIDGEKIALAEQTKAGEKLLSSAQAIKDQAVDLAALTQKSTWSIEDNEKFAQDKQDILTQFYNSDELKQAYASGDQKKIDKAEEDAAIARDTYTNYLKDILKSTNTFTDISTLSLNGIMKLNTTAEQQRELARAMALAQQKMETQALEQSQTSRRANLQQQNIDAISNYQTSGHSVDQQTAAGVATGVTLGAASGAVTGAYIGTALGTVFPGIGNIIGAAAGVIIGGAVGVISGVIAKNEEKKAQEKKAQEIASMSLENQVLYAENELAKAQASGNTEQIRLAQELLDSVQSIQAETEELNRQIDESKISEALLSVSNSDNQYLANMSNAQLNNIGADKIIDLVAQELVRTGGLTQSAVYLNGSNGQITEYAYNEILKMLKDNEIYSDIINGKSLTLSEALKLTTNETKDQDDTADYKQNAAIQRNFMDALNLSSVDQLEQYEDRFGSLKLSDLLLTTNELQDKLSNVRGVMDQIASGSKTWSETQNMIIKSYPELIAYMNDAVSLQTAMLDKIVAYADLDINSKFNDIATNTDYYSTTIQTALEEAFGKNSAEMNKLAADGITTLNDLMKWTVRNENGEFAEASKNIQNIIDQQLQGIELVSDTQKEILKSVISYQTTMMDRQISNLEGQKSALSEINTQREYENKLIEAKLKLENASKEKKRVWREGIGWTYETDQNAIQEAQEDLNSLNTEKQIAELTEQITELQAGKDRLNSISSEEELSKQKALYDAWIKEYQENGVLNTESIASLYTAFTDTNSPLVQTSKYANDIYSILKDNLGKSKKELMGYTETDSNGNTVAVAGTLETSWDKLKNAATALNKYKKSDGTYDYSATVKDENGNDVDFNTAANNYNTALREYQTNFSQASKNNFVSTNDYDTSSGSTLTDDSGYMSGAALSAGSSWKEVGLDSGKDYFVVKGMAQLFDYLDGNDDYVLRDGAKFTPSGKFWSDAIRNDADVIVWPKGDYDGPTRLTTKETKNWDDPSEMASKYPNSIFYTWDHENTTRFFRTDDSGNFYKLNSYRLSKQGELGYGKYNSHSDNYKGKEDYFEDHDFEPYYFAEGTLGVPSFINELGTEAIITPHGTLTALPSKTGVVPADITANLWQLGEIAPSILRTLDSPHNTTVHTNSNAMTTDESFNINTLTMNVSADKSFDINEFVHSIKTQAALKRNKTA